MTYNEIMEAVIAAFKEVAAYQDESGEFRPVVGCDFVSYLAAGIWMKTVSEIGLSPSVIFSDDPEGKIKHVYEHKLVECGMILERLRATGRIEMPIRDQDETAPPGVKSLLDYFQEGKDEEPGELPSLPVEGIESFGDLMERLERYAKDRLEGDKPEDEPNADQT